MALEIERKFLLKGDFKPYVERSERIVQGYLSSVPERTVRVRIKGDSAYLTIKGKTNVSGLSRYEWEKEISIDEAHELIHLCESGVIDKTRYYISAGDYLFEIDEFDGENEGLVIAEIELANEKDDFPCPEWLGDEVTGDTRYYNAMLSKNPYSKWSK